MHLHTVFIDYLRAHWGVLSAGNILVAYVVLTVVALRLAIVETVLMCEATTLTSPSGVHISVNSPSNTINSDPVTVGPVADVHRPRIDMHARSVSRQMMYYDSAGGSSVSTCNKEQQPLDTTV